ncbi:hypothetical protein HPB48_007115 [Haemaphysalis longicornis]|uniref:Uncharacterized protein n=1 Tax=Haemaphysalis longicornis TaxID=44386 RepID=A0A9J6GVA1_HAELO|nr:hypothetical protein HPB48_007115 [Haemaphysalis longicornis]
MEVLEAIEKSDSDLISIVTTSKGETVETVPALLAKLCEKEADDDVHQVFYRAAQRFVRKKGAKTLVSVRHGVRLLNFYHFASRLQAHP